MRPVATWTVLGLASLIVAAAPAMAQEPPPKIEGRTSPPAGVEPLEDTLPEPPRQPGVRGLAGLSTGNALPGRAEPPADPPGLGRPEDLPEPPREPGVRGVAGPSTGNAMPGRAEPPADPPGVGPPEDLPEPPGNRRPTARGLLDKLESRPGGAAKVEAARRRARRGGGAAPFEPAAGSGPFDGGGLGLVRSVAPVQEWSVTMTPTAPYPSSGNQLQIYGGMTRAYYPHRRSLYASYSYSTLGAARSYDFLQVTINVPEDGWYILNVYGYMSSSTIFEIRDAYTSGAPVIETVSPADHGWQDQPVLLELGAGYHGFFIPITSGYITLLSVEAFKVAL